MSLRERDAVGTITIGLHVRQGAPVMPKALSLLLASLFVAPAAPEEPPVKRIAFLVLPGVYTNELIAPFDVFYQLRFHIESAPEVFTVGPHSEALTTFEGLELSPHYSLERAPQFEVLVIPSAEQITLAPAVEPEGLIDTDEELQAARLSAWLRRSGLYCKLYLALGRGAFLLGQSNLLERHEAVTSPNVADPFRKAFPGVRSRRGLVLVHDGRVVTSVGGAQSYGAALYVVELLYGRRVSRAVANSLEIGPAVNSTGVRRTPRAVSPGRPRP